MNKPTKKITGWAACYQKPGAASHLVVVVAHSRDQAAAMMEEAGEIVVDERQIRPVTLLAGHDWFPDVPEFEWQGTPSCDYCTVHEEDET